MAIGRLFRHLTIPPWRLRRAFPSAVLEGISQAIARTEATHSGQIRFVVEQALDPVAVIRGRTARERALELFSLLGVWDTAQNNGVLVYLLFADHDVEIVADRGVDAKVGNAGWEQICRQMEDAFRQERFAEGVLAGVAGVSRHLQAHFPRNAAGPNELSDRPVVL